MHGRKVCSSLLPLKRIFHLLEKVSPPQKKSHDKFVFELHKTHLFTGFKHFSCGHAEYWDIAMVTKKLQHILFLYYVFSSYLCWHWGTSLYMWMTFLVTKYYLNFLFLFFSVKQKHLIMFFLSYSQTSFVNKRR